MSFGGGFGQPQQAGGFGQPVTGAFGQKPGGFGQSAAPVGFGQPQAGGFGQPQAGGFGQPQQTGGFGQPQQAGGFGQPQQAGGFGQPQQAGGFGQSAAGGFGQPQQPAGGFGQPAAPGGFGQPQQQAGGFGQPQAGGFGQPQQVGGFGQPAAGGFGQPQQQAGGFGQKPAGGFGQPAAPGGFGQPQQQAGGFGQPQAGGFGQPQQVGGFGQPAAGGFGQPQQQAGGFGQKPAGGFGQPAAPGGFGQPQQQAGGFGQPAAGGFGQPQQQTGGFGQKPAGGFGQPQQPAAGGFGQTATPVGGFGQPLAQAGGFGQQPVSGGFGQQPTPAVGFGQPQGSGFGQPTTGGFGQPARPTTGFGAPTGGFSQPAAPAGSFGVAATPAPAAPSVGLVFQPTDLSFMSLPDFNSKPYGDVLLYARYDKPEIPKPTADPLENVVVNRPSFQSWWTRNPVPDPDVFIKQHTAALNASSVSAAAIKDLLNPSIQMGVGAPVEAPTDKGDINFVTDPVFHHGDTVTPLCRNPDYTTVPPIEELNRMTTSELHHVCNFQVRRRDGKAIIHFLEPVNLVRVDIAEVVLISRDGRVQLYPHQPPPPPGTGLNVTARVTVHDMWNTNEDALRERCRAGNNRFISYSHHTWVYEMGTGCSVSPARPSIESENEDRMSIVDEEEEEGVATLDSLRKSHVSTTLVEPPVSGQLIRPPVQVQVPFDLPYAVPNMSKKDPIAAPDVVLSQAKVTLERPAYYLDKKESEIYAKIVSRQKTEKGSSAGELCRSYRAGWRGDGVLAVPAFAELHDGLEEHPDVRETRGAHVSLMSPYVWNKPSTKPLTVCLVAVLRHVLQYVTVTAANDAQGNEAMKVALSKGHYGLAVIGLSREKTSVSLSEEKLEHVLWSVRDSVPANLSTTEARSLRQYRSVVSLLSAMYGLPESDVANANPMEESRYLRQLRHRNLATWLRAELTDLVSASTTSFKSKAEELVQIMLCHRLREAREVAKELNSEDLVRVVRVCGEGNQFGSYVAMAKTGFRDGAEVRERVVSLLSGRVEPFMEEEYIMRADTEAVSANSRAATWKQLLGIFVFYGCTPDTPAEDIICSFMDRLEQPATHRPNSLPPYAEKIDKEVVQTRRGADAARRGHTFQDAAMLILKGYAAGTTPPAMCLHPHSSSYCSMDYLSPLIILLAVRALQLPRDRCYVDAEITVLLGAAAALETNDETWYWGLLPLHLIECDADRWQAVRDFCHRNAKRASCMTDNPTKSELRKIIEVLCVDETALRPIVIASEERKEASRNMPSIKTHEALQQAMKKLTVSSV